MQYLALGVGIIVAYAAGHSDQRNDNGFGCLATLVVGAALQLMLHIGAN